MVVGWDAYGTSQEQAYGVLAALMAALDTVPVSDVLEMAGLAHHNTDAVADVSALLNTAYEGRAHMDSEFGMMSRLQLDAGRMDSADISGTVATDDGIITVDTTVTRGDA